jgi:uncharacterized protein (TIGR01777 family)
MRVIIAGGTGLIGRALARDLVSEDNQHQVIVLSRNLDRATDLPSGVQVQRWDARSAEGWGHLADGADAIVNLAGESLLGYWTAARKRRILESRIDAGRAVVRAVEAARARPGVVVQASGINYYAPAADREVAEGAPPGDDFLGRTAVHWEASTAPVESLGARRVILRNGLVLSLAGGSFPLVVLPFRLFVGGPLGTGRQWFPWIHIADAVRIIRFAIDEERATGPFNAVAPQTVTYADLCRILSRVMRRPSWIRVPVWALRLVLGQMRAVILDGQRAVPRKLLDLGFSFRFPDIESALRDVLKRQKGV